MSFFNLAGKDMGIDLGTSTVLVALKDKGIVINEPAVIAVDKKTGNLLATGRDAKDMLGKAPDKIKVIKPLKQGVIADLVATQLMIADIMKRIQKKYGISRTRAVVGIPSGITEVEQRAVEEAVYNAGVKQVYLIEEPLASAIGATIDISQPAGNLIVDMGSGTTEVAVISLGGIVVSQSLRIAGDDLNQNIIDYIRKNENVAIGENIAESIKTTIASAKSGKLETMTVKGRDLETGFPKVIEINSEQVREAISNSLMQIVNVIKLALEKTPPELLSDITERGITLTGGGALIKRIDELIHENTGINVYISDNPLESVVNGAVRTIEDVKKLKQLQAKRRK